MIYEECFQATSSSQKRASLSDVEVLMQRKLGYVHLTCNSLSTFLKMLEATMHDCIVALGHWTGFRIRSSGSKKT